MYVHLGWWIGGGVVLGLALCWALHKARRDLRTWDHEDDWP